MLGIDRLELSLAKVIGKSVICGNQLYVKLQVIWSIDGTNCQAVHIQLYKFGELILLVNELVCD